MIIPTAHRLHQVEEYYFSRKLAELRQLDGSSLPVINLGIGSPDLPPAPAVIEALGESARQPGHHGYQSYKGVPQFRAAIAAFSKATYGLQLDPEKEILPLMGSKEGILHICLAFLNEGDEILVPDPGYPTYRAVANLLGVNVRTYPMLEAVEGGIDLEALGRQDLSRVKLMWINFPHMPTGIRAATATLEKLVALAREKKFLLVNDNPYSLILNPNPLSLLAQPGAAEVALELNSLSKSHNMAGWRIGWLAGSSNYIDAVLRVKSNQDSGMFLGLQHAAIEALKSGAEWFEGLNAIYARRKETGLALMKALGCTPHPEQSGMFIWARVPDSIPDVEKWVDEILYGTHVFLTPGFIFGPAGSRYLRLSLCTPEEKLKEALQRIESFLSQHPYTPKSQQHAL
jgi:LL-diaminopimelate aminotransferase